MGNLEKAMIRRKSSSDQFDSLFTTVYEPYQTGKKYIESVAAENVVGDQNEKVMKVTAIDGTPGADDVAKAVRVEINDPKKGIKRTDYVVYATNNNVTYKVEDVQKGESFEFKGIVGVWTLNENGIPIYSYLTDGEFIRDAEVTTNTNRDPKIEGTIVDFQRELSLDNWVKVKFDRPLTKDEANGLRDRMINIDLHNSIKNRKAPGNSVFPIEGVTWNEATPDEATLSFGGMSIITDYVDQFDETKGYVYATKVGDVFEIAMSYEDTGAPEFAEVKDQQATAEKTYEIVLNATAQENGGKVTYAGRELPRGATIDKNTGKIIWRPTASQIGTNLISVDAKDELGRISTITFEVDVLGATTDNGNDETTTTDPDEGEGSGDNGGGGSGGGGGGGGGSEEQPTDEDKPTDEKPEDNEGGNVSGGEIGFIDLGNHAWASDAINSLADAGIIKGTSENTYSPANNITRADYALLLVRAFELTSENEENFSDVSPSDYFARELAIARNEGTVGGIGDNKYAPRNTITRQDMMVIMYRALTKLGVELQSGEVDYTDYDEVSDYAKEAVSALITSGLVNGKNGKIEPKANTTRAEIAVLLKRVLDYIANK